MIQFTVAVQGKGESRICAVTFKYVHRSEQLPKVKMIREDSFPLDAGNQAIIREEVTIRSSHYTESSWCIERKPSILYFRVYEDGFGTP